MSARLALLAANFLVEAMDGIKFIFNFYYDIKPLNLGLAVHLRMLSAAKIICTAARMDTLVMRREVDAHAALSRFHSTKRSLPLNRNRLNKANLMLKLKNQKAALSFARIVVHFALMDSHVAN